MPMILNFAYSQSSQLNGFFRYLYKNGWDALIMSSITYKANSVDGSHTADSAFKFNSGEYWIALPSSTRNNTLTFCLNKYSANINGIELQTSNQGALIKSFAIEGSKNERNWFNYQKFTYSYRTNEAHYFTWNHGPLKCIKIYCLGNTKYPTNNNFDLKQIELYGTFTYRTNIKTFFCLHFIKRIQMFSIFTSSV